MNPFTEALICGKPNNAKTSPAEMFNRCRNDNLMKNEETGA